MLSKPPTDAYQFLPLKLSAFVRHLESEGLCRVWVGDLYCVRKDVSQREERYLSSLPHIDTYKCSFKWVIKHKVLNFPCNVTLAGNLKTHTLYETDLATLDRRSYVMWLVFVKADQPVDPV